MMPPRRLLLYLGLWILQTRLDRQFLPHDLLLLNQIQTLGADDRKVGRQHQDQKADYQDRQA